MSARNITITTATLELLVERAGAAKEAAINEEVALATYYMEDLERILQLVDANCHAATSAHDELALA